MNIKRLFSDYKIVRVNKNQSFLAKKYLFKGNLLHEKFDKSFSRVYVYYQLKITMNYDN